MGDTTTALKYPTESTVWNEVGVGTTSTSLQAAESDPGHAFRPTGRTNLWACKRTVSNDESPCESRLRQITYGMRKYMDTARSVCQASVCQTDRYGNRDTSRPGPVGL